MHALAVHSFATHLIQCTRFEQALQCKCLHCVWSVDFRVDSESVFRFVVTVYRQLAGSPARGDGRRRRARGDGGRARGDGQIRREFVKQHPGPEQVDLCVEIEVPGSWFGGNLNATERSLKYKAQEIEYDDVREFPGLTPKSRKTKEKVIPSLCIVDAAVDPNSDGYWMKLSQWNRFRHDT